jgi:Fe-Mn family superoxide dismutase
MSVLKARYRTDFATTGRHRGSIPSRTRNTPENAMQIQSQPSPVAGRAPPMPDSHIPSVHELPPLPYEFNALAPVISEYTVRTHYLKHNKGYVDELNKLVAKSEFVGMSLEQIICAAADKPQHVRIFNNAAQAWNHAFYWNSLKPQGGGDAPGALQTMVAATFGDTHGLKRELAAAATAQFGSGWAWLALDGGRLKIVNTGNAGNVLTQGLKPLLVIDVWEHAYYLDFQNRRAEYVADVLDKLVNWQFAADNLRRGSS